MLASSDIVGGRGCSNGCRNVLNVAAHVSRQTWNWTANFGGTVRFVSCCGSRRYQEWSKESLHGLIDETLKWNSRNQSHCAKSTLIVNDMIMDYCTQYSASFVNTIFVHPVEEAPFLSFMLVKCQIELVLFLLDVYLSMEFCM